MKNSAFQFGAWILLLFFCNNCISLLTKSGQERWIREKIFEQINESFRQSRIFLKGQIPLRRVNREKILTEQLDGARYQLMIKNDQTTKNMKYISSTGLISTRAFEAIYLRFGTEYESESIVTIKTLIDIDENFSDPVVTVYEIGKSAAKISAEVQYNGKINQAQIDILLDTADNKFSASFYRKNFLFQELLAFHFLKLIPLPIQEAEKAITCKAYEKNNICQKLVYTEGEIEKVVLTAESPK